jgi:hypothetical protein
MTVGLFLAGDRRHQGPLPGELVGAVYQFAASAAMEKVCFYWRVGVGIALAEQWRMVLGASLVAGIPRPLTGERLSPLNRRILDSLIAKGEPRAILLKFMELEPRPEDPENQDSEESLCLYVSASKAVLEWFSATYALRPKHLSDYLTNIVRIQPCPERTPGLLTYLPQQAKDQALLCAWRGIAASFGQLAIPPPTLPLSTIACNIREWMQDVSNKQYLDNVRYLNLGQMRLKLIPEEVRLLPRLEHVIATANQIDEIPHWIGELTKLRKLILSMNQIKEIPPEIERCQQLEVIDLETNNIREIPIEIGRLPHLQELALHANFPFCAVVDPSDVYISCSVQGERLQQFQKALRHPCQSALARLCQAIMRGKMNEERLSQLEDIFMDLPSPDRMIFDRRWGARLKVPVNNFFQGTTGEPQFRHLQQMFASCVKETILEIFDKLSLKEKERVCETVCALAASVGDSVTDNERWDEAYVLSNLPRLADAL